MLAKAVKGFLSFEQTVHQNTAFSSEKVISSNIHVPARRLVEIANSFIVY